MSEHSNSTRVVVLGGGYVGTTAANHLKLHADERDGAADVVLAESVSMAMLVLLETLGPDERAVFVLREVFGFDHEEIAEAVGKSVAAVRQIAHRAREHVHARRTRYQPADAATTAVIEQFMTAAATGDVAGLVATLAPDIVWTADGGGKASAARRPIVGAERTAAVILGLFRQLERSADPRVEPVVCNGAPAVIIHRGDQLEGVFLIEVVEGLFTHFYAVRNPDKLAAIAEPRTISREVSDDAPG